MTIKQLLSFLSLYNPEVEVFLYSDDSCDSVVPIGTVQPVGQRAGSHFIVISPRKP